MIRRILAAGILVGALYFLFFGGDYTFLDLWRIDNDYDREVAELEAVRSDLAELRERADSLATDSAALERLARERFGLIREGERLYRFVEPDPAAERDRPTARDRRDGDAAPVDDAVPDGRADRDGGPRP